MSINGNENKLKENVIRHLLTLLCWEFHLHTQSLYELLWNPA